MSYNKTHLGIGISVILRNCHNNQWFFSKKRSIFGNSNKFHIRLMLYVIRWEALYSCNERCRPNNGHLFSIWRTTSFWKGKRASAWRTGVQRITPFRCFNPMNALLLGMTPAHVTRQRASPPQFCAIILL